MSRKVLVLHLIASITADGRAEYRRLTDELAPSLDSVIRSVTLIKCEIYGAR